MTTEEIFPAVVPNIYQKVHKIMGELDYIQKGPKSVNGQYRYASHDQVTAAIHPYLVKYGIVIIPTVQEMTQESNRTVCKLALVFVNADCPTDNFTVTQFGYGVDSGDKGPGKAVSYAYKYGLLKTFCLETGDDPDEDANSSYEPAKCLEFDLLIPTQMSSKERDRLQKFLEYSAECMKKHVEEVKREAIGRMSEFLSAFKSWNLKQKDKA